MQLTDRLDERTVSYTHLLDVEVVAMRFELLLASGDRIVLEHVRIDVVALNLIAAERLSLIHI